MKILLFFDVSLTFGIYFFFWKLLLQFSKKFENETRIFIDPVKQLEKETKDKEWDLEL